MCGIVGIWETRSSEIGWREDQVRRSMSTIHHRGPDSHGVWSAADAGLTLGHQRLSIIDVSPQGHQPMQSADGRYVVCFNGEIFNFQELRSALQSEGVSFKSRSDTEVLVEGFARWGEDVLQRMVGQFAFAIWDDKERRLFLARDRFGEKPLYFCRTPRFFAFASEIQALRSLPGVDLAVEPAAVQLYLEQLYVPAPHSIHAGIKKLPPAHAMWVDVDSDDQKTYWDPLYFATQPVRAVSEGQALEELDELLRRSVQQQMISDVPLGAFLSGGVDSTTVVAMMTQLSTIPVQTFTIGFDVDKYSEADHAAAVARHLGTEHTCEYLTLSQAMELVPGVPATYGEPFADASALPTQLVSQVARKSVTVSLSGDGGDEIFGGYVRYDQYEKLAETSRWLGPLPGIAAPMLRGMPGRVGRLANHVMGGIERDPYRPINSCFNALEVRELTGLPNTQYEIYDQAWSRTAGLSPRRRAMTTDLVTYMPEAILVKVDRAAMSTSLEVRAPFLDHRLVEWSFGLPLELIKKKKILKEHVYKSVPRNIMERPKMGFGIPVAEWFKDGLRGLMEDALAPAAMERVGVTNAAAVRRYIDDHLSGKSDNGNRIWSLVVLSLWGAEAL